MSGRAREVGGFPGGVCLVGAGPGDPELITVRGLKRLRQAQVLLYDRLVHPDLVAEAPASCQRIYVGKRPGFVALEQRAIERLMVERARRGLRVVRLKGGDPFLFGRGGEEALACVEAGVPCEIVPGLTSALAAPAAFGVPLTHRGVAASFSVVPGHRPEELGPSLLAGADTLVVLMGVGELESLCRRVMAAGRCGSTPAAIVERGTWPEQRIVTARLVELAERAKGAGISPPATVVIGEVVDLAAGISQCRAEPVIPERAAS